jgi:hypothetical protein
MITRKSVLLQQRGYQGIYFIQSTTPYAIDSVLNERMDETR